MSGNYFEYNQVMNRMQVMCEESLCPDHYEIWEIIKKALYETRSSLKESTCTIDPREDLPNDLIAALAHEDGE